MADETLDLKSSKAARDMHNKIVDFTRTQYRAIRNARVSTERQWYLNLAFYSGKQNVALLRPQALGAGTTTKLWVPPAPNWRARPVINKIRPTIRQELAQLTNNKPSASIVPSSAEDRDMYAAMAGEQIWENLYIDHKLKFVIRRAMWWTLLCGTGFIKTYWDPTKGKVVDIPSPMGNIQRPEGDICFTAETPFNVLAPDLREEEIENQPFIIHAQSKSPEWIQMRYGNVNSKSGDDASDLLEDSFLNLVGSQQPEKHKNLIVFECWIKPGAHPLFPEGAFYTMIGNQIVQGQMGLPYSHGQFPFAKIDHIPGGKFYSTSSVEDLVPLQKEYNRTRGQIIEAKNRMGKPQLYGPRGSVDPKKITSEPGLFIEYTPGFEPPKPMPIAPLPAYIIQELDRINQDWNEISGQSQVSKGEVPPGVTAATAISFLQERDETKLSPTFDSLEEAIEKTARHSLIYVKDYWDIERKIKITGPDGSFDVMAFQGSDLRDNLDIRIEAGSSLPVSKAARQALIMDLMKMGFVMPQQGLEVMDMGGLNKIYERLQVDRRQAQRENLRMSKVTDETMAEYEQSMMPQQEMQPPVELGALDVGLDLSGNMMPPDEIGIDPMSGMVPEPEPIPLIVPVNSWDNHQVHIQYHNEFRKGQAFENLPTIAKELFEQHVQQHIAAIGIEQYSQNPSIVSGLPPLPSQPGEDSKNPIDESIAQGDTPPGPQPMPELMGGEQ